MLELKINQSSGSTHIQQTSQKKFKQMYACQKTDDNCFLGQERSADGGIYAVKDHNIRSLLRNTKKKNV
jgi:hypothetical protein